MSFFADIFFVEVREDGLVSLSVRANQNRVDEFVLSWSDIAPALDDAPLPGWMGSSRFSLKRCDQFGQLRIAGSEKSSVYRFSRHEIDKLHAQLYALQDQVDAEAQLADQQTVVSPVHESRKAEPVVSQPVDVDALVGQLSIMMQQQMERLRKDLGAMKAVETVKIIEKAVPVEVEVPVMVEPEPDPFSPSGIFIPSRLGQGLEGTVHKKQTTTNSALGAAEKLRKLKEKK